MSVTWEPGKPWTHPSIQRLTNEALRAKLATCIDMLDRHRQEFADHPDRDTVNELLDDYRDRIKTYRTALRERGEAA